MAEARQKQSFRVAAKEFAKGPVVLHLTASGDLERLGKSFALLGAMRCMI